MANTAVILCGGKGDRLKPLTDNIPKALVPINGKPMIEYHIDWLEHYGIKKIILACGYLWEKIKEKYGDEFRGIKLVYSVENEPLGTGGAIKKALEFVDEEEFIAANCDDINNVNIDELRKIGSNTICLSRFRCNFGIVDTKGNKVLGFRQKPVLPYWANMGVYILNKNIPLPDKGAIETDTFQKIELKAYKHKGIWVTVNTKKDLDEVEEFLKNHKLF